MAIAQAAVKLLMKEGIRRPLTGRVLTLGKQEILLTNIKLQEIAIKMNVKLSVLADSGSSAKENYDFSKHISDVELFRRLGFSELRSLDNSDYEGADEIFDLNSPDLPAHLKGAFDVIIDVGTIEHVFHLPNALTNITKMIREGGRIIHLSPSSNHIDHGFYMFSPTLFYDYYCSNRFEINTFQIFEYSQRHWIEPWLIYDYTPGSLGSVSFGGLDEAMYGIFCVVTKNKDSSYGVIPQQGAYVKAWSSSKSQHKQKPINKKNSVFMAIKSAIKTNYYAYRISLPIVQAVRHLKSRCIKTRKGVNLKVKARY